MSDAPSGGHMDHNIYLHVAPRAKIPPNAEEKMMLCLAGLGEKKVSLKKNGNAAHVF